MSDDEWLRPKDITGDDFLFFCDWNSGVGYATGARVTGGSDQFHGDYRVAAEMGFYRRCAQRAEMASRVHGL